MKQKFKKIITIGSLAGLSAVLLFSCSLRENKKNQNKTDIVEVEGITEEKSSMEEIQQELMDVNLYLEKLDATVLTNQEAFSAISGTDNTFISQAEILEQEIWKIQESVSQFIDLYETGDEEIQNQLSEILAELEGARADLVGNYKEVLAAFKKSDDKQKNRQEILEEKLSVMKESISDIQGKLEQSHSKLLSVMDTMKEINEEFHKEKISYMENLYEKLSELILKDTEQLLMMIEASDSRIQLQINAGVKSLSKQMVDIHSQIATTQEEVEQLLSVMENEEKARQEEVIESFESVKASLALIQKDYSSAHDEIKSLFQDLNDKSDRNYTDLAAMLGQMDKNMEESAIANVTKIMESLDYVSKQYTEGINQINEQYVAINQINQNHVESLDLLNNEMTNQFQNMDTNINKQIGILNASLSNQYDSLTTIVNSGDESLKNYLENVIGSVNQKLDSVFQLVSSGKKLLASALLTKGVTVSGDATFYKISQAILEIPQNMELESQEMHGTVTYDYHYHEDVNGATPHAEWQEQMGGCYVTPVYHIHSGNSAGGGCYTTPLYHSHSGNSISGGGCYTVVIAHTHNSGCQTKKVIANGGTATSCDGTFMYISVGVYKCSRCGASSSSGGTCKAYNPHYETVYDCNIAADGYNLGCGKTTSTVVSYNLGCGKSVSTVDYYSAGCGFVDRMVVGVHIIYYGNNAKE